MKFFDWSIGYVYIVCYVDSVSLYPEQVVVSSRQYPVTGIARAALGLTQQCCHLAGFSPAYSTDSYAY